MLSGGNALSPDKNAGKSVAAQADYTPGGRAGGKLTPRMRSIH